MDKQLYAKYKHPDWPSSIILPIDDPIENYLFHEDWDDLTYSEIELTDEEYDRFRRFGEI